MKKTKFLTSLTALALVLSLGACAETEEDSTGSEETSSETSSSSSSTSTEPQTATLNNYTLSITLKDEEGEPVAIPFYDSIYIQGSWDNWAEWVPLTNIGTDNEPILTTTFATIEEGTYEFKGLVGLTDSGDPKWESEDWTELIVAEDGKSNATFTVNAEDGNNYTNNLEFIVDATKVPVLEETPMDDETIAGLIIEASKDVYSNIGWDAFHGYEAEDNEKSIEVWFTTDDEGGLYGKVICYDEGQVDETRYITDGVAYTIDADNEYDSFNYSQEYEDEFSNYADALDTIGDAEASDCVITHTEGTTTYTLTLTDEDEILTIVSQRAGDTFTVISARDSDDGDVYFAEEINATDVQAQMEGFNPDDWAAYEHNAFNELISAVNEGHNYYAESYYYLYQSNEVEYSQEGMASAQVSVVQAYGCWMYATEDAMLQQYIVYQSSSWYYYTVYLYVNDYASGLTAVYGLSGSTIYDLSLLGYYYGTWEDNFSTIGDLADYRSDIVIGESESTGVFAYGDVEDYDVYDNALDALLDCTIGNNDIWDYWFAEGMGWNYYFGYADAADIYYYSEYLSGGLYTGFDAILEVAFDTYGWYYASTSDHDHVLYQEVLAFTDIYPDKTGVTEIPDGYAQYLS